MCGIIISGTLQDESTSNPMSLDSRDFESISNMISTDNVGEPLWKREPPGMLCHFIVSVLLLGLS